MLKVLLIFALICIVSKISPQKLGGFIGSSIYKAYHPVKKKVHKKVQKYPAFIQPLKLRYAYSNSIRKAIRL